MRRHASTQARRAVGILNLPLALATGLFMFLAIDSIYALLEISRQTALQRQVDITAGSNVAAWFSAGVFAATGLSATAIARLKARSDNARLASAAGWIVVGGALLAMAVIEISGMPSIPINMMIFVPIAAILLLVFLYHQLWHLAVSRGLLILAFMLLLSNPVTEQAKVRLLSNSDNYVFVSNSEPYRFKRDAWSRLWLVSHVQEATEIAGILCLLHVFLIAGTSPLHRHSSRSVVTSHATLHADETRTIRRE